MPGVAHRKTPEIGADLVSLVLAVGLTRSQRPSDLSLDEWEALLAPLYPVERLAVVYRVVYGMRVEPIGDVLGVCKQRAHQLIEKGLRRLAASGAAARLLDSMSR